MFILVLNSGSSSLKYQLFDFAQTSPTVLAKGVVEQIGEKTGVSSHTAALEHIVDLLCVGDSAVIKDPQQIAVVGHRVVHGGDRFAASTIITDEVLQSIKECSYLAPLHNPANIVGIEGAMRIFSSATQVAVFDTAFHQTLPEYAYLYALPYELYEKHKLRRYGFHGTSHFYVAKQAAELLQRPLNQLNLITLHIGNGASVACIQAGKSVDTSMGLTPLEGLVMGTRSGDVDPALIEFIADVEQCSIKEVIDLLNKKSGLKGICGDNDLRNIWARVEQGDKLATKAVEIYAYRIKKYIGAYYAVLGRVDALVFTAGVGENDSRMRKLILRNLDALNIKLDDDLNRDNETFLSTSGIPILRIATNEELEIARQSFALVH